MNPSVSLKDEIWFVSVCNHISNAVYTRYNIIYQSGILCYATGRCIQLHVKQNQVPAIRPEFGLWSCQRQNLKAVTVTFLLANLMFF
jgi:hypothetical protein